MKQTLALIAESYIGIQIVNFGSSFQCVLESQYTLEVFKLLCSISIGIAIRYFEKKYFTKK